MTYFLVADVGRCKQVLIALAHVLSPSNITARDYKDSSLVGPLSIVIIWARTTHLQYAPKVNIISCS